MRCPVPFLMCLLLGGVTFAQNHPGSEVVDEQVVPGTEPHSPSTLGRAASDPNNARSTPGSGGSISVMRVGSAYIGRPGVVRFSFLGEYFRRNNFPLQGE